MTRAEFDAYIADYNSHDIGRLFRHYSPDLIFENFGGHRAGAAAFAFLEGLSHVVNDSMDVQQVLIDGDALAMEAVNTMTAIIDAPTLPIGAMRQGEHKVMRMFAFYRTEGAIIHHIKVSGWPA